MVARCVAVVCVQCRRSPDETGGGGGCECMVCMYAMIRPLKGGVGQVSRWSEPYVMP